MNKTKNLTEKIFEKLTVIDRAPNPGTRKNDTAAYWNCRCECGKTIVIRGYSLTSGKTKSCGCLKLEAPHLPFLKESQPKYSSEISAAHDVWHSRYSELLFEEFYKLSQLKCYYCGTEPMLAKSARQKDNSKLFIYNTLDRINSNLGHTSNNIVTACLTCNRAKLDRSVQDFYQYIDNIVNNLYRASCAEYRKLLYNIIIPSDIHNSQLTSIKSRYVDYHDGELSLKQFYQLATANCYYCDSKPANYRNVMNKQSSKDAKSNGTFIYNGLDRVDNNLPHNYENVVPCCKYCNSAKNQLSLQDFNNWITKLAKHKRV